MEVFFFWYQKVVLNGMQLCSVQVSGTIPETVTRNLLELASRFLCKKLLQVSGTTFLFVSPVLGILELDFTKITFYLCLTGQFFWSRFGLGWVS